MRCEAGDELREFHLNLRQLRHVCAQRCIWLHRQFKLQFTQVQHCYHKINIITRSNCSSHRCSTVTTKLTSSPGQTAINTDGAQLPQTNNHNEKCIKSLLPELTISFLSCYKEGQLRQVTNDVLLADTDTISTGLILLALDETLKRVKNTLSIRTVYNSAHFKGRPFFQTINRQTKSYLTSKQ